MKLFKCKHCGNIITMVEDKGVPVVCCGEKMTELVPNTTDAAQEKHVPEVSIATVPSAENLTEIHVYVGSVRHPMTEEHLIAHIFLETTKGVYRVDLTATDEPEATFIIDSEAEKPLAAYEYCNLHGFWVKQI